MIIEPGELEELGGVHGRHLTAVLRVQPLPVDFILGQKLARHLYIKKDYSTLLQLMQIEGLVSNYFNIIASFIYRMK